MADYSPKPSRAFSHLILLLSLIVLGCSTAKQSKFSSHSVTIGMDKKDVMIKFGAPYKTSLHQDSNHLNYEDWYYKENLFIEKWYEVTTIFCFQGDKLVSMKPGKETPLYKGDTFLR